MHTQDEVKATPIGFIFPVHFGLSSFLHKGLLLCSRPSRIMQSVHKATGRQPCCSAIQFSDLETMVQGHC